MLNQRASSLLSVILSNRMITIKQLEKKLDCTRRQVGYDLEKINDWLESENLPAIENVPDRGLVVNEKTRTEVYKILPQLDMISYILSLDDRVRIIFIMIFIKQDYISVNHFTDALKMSRNTVLSDIQLVKKKLEKDGIGLVYNRQKGYGLVGNEIKIRSLAFNNISNFLQLSNGIQLLDAIYDVQEDEGAFQKVYQTTYMIIGDVEKDLNVSFIDDQIVELSTFFVFLLARIRGDGKVQIPQDIIDTIKTSATYFATRKLVEKLKITTVDDEIIYISMHLLGLNKSDHGRIFIQSQNDALSDELSNVITRIISDFEKLACVTFTNSAVAKKALLSHLKPAYYRILFKIPITNYYLDKIKQEYFDLFILVKKSLSGLEELLKCPIPEAEVGYITLHFGAFLKREGIIYRRKRCIIICPNGVATSHMLKKEIEQFIPEVEVVKVTTPREYHKFYKNDIDFILSTVSIQTDKPLIIVSPILTALDKSKVFREVNFLLYQKQLYVPKVNELMRVIRRYSTVHNESAIYQAINEVLTGSMVKDYGRFKPMLDQLLIKETIQLKEGVDTWKNAIRIAAQPLLNNGSIEERYIDAMITSVEEMGPYIVLAPKVAMPHARPEDGVKKVGMSLLKINNPVQFSETDSEKNVNLIIVISAIDNETHLKALSQLSELLEDESTISELIEATSQESVLVLIEKFSQ